MVKPLSPSVMLNITQCMFCVLLVAVTSMTGAEQLTDPTRPPDSLGAAQSGGAGTPAGPELQSVLISPQRRMAIISGKTLKIGDKFGSSQIVGINETEVVLRNGKDMQTLKLFPDVQKRPASHGVGAKTDH